MTCDVCKDVIEVTDMPHVVRRCVSCGRELHVASPGEHGKGIAVGAGESLVIPGGWIRLSLNPLKSSGYLYRGGIEFLAHLVFIGDLDRGPGVLPEQIAKLDNEIIEIFKSSPRLADLDLDDPADAQKVFARLSETKTGLEWWAYCAGMFQSIHKEAISQGNVEQAVWAMACVERFRTMMIFKQELEEVVWMGSSAKRVVDALAVWDANRENDMERFWQDLFAENPYILSQVFAVPIVFVRGKAYVGGMKVDSKEAKFVDYLFSLESTRESVLFEIKTPKTRLLGSEYRGGVYAPSAELSGAVIQVVNYRSELIRNLASISMGREEQIHAFDPRCVLVIGNASEELDSSDKVRSFEQFRSTQKDVEVITYDELYRKVEILANLFGLVRRNAT